MKKMMILTAAAIAASMVCDAQYTTRRTGRTGSSYGSAASRRAATIAAADAEDAAGLSAREQKLKNTVRLEMPKTGRNNATFVAPSTGQTFVQCNQKERRWIVLEAKYSNPVRQDRLTFTWHVLLDMQTADKDVRGDWDNPALAHPPSRYSYFTTSVTYENVPSDKTVAEHAASVCLAPSYLECYGEPKAVGIEIRNKDGELMDGGFGVESEMKEIKSITPRILGNPALQEELAKAAFWKNPAIMEAEYKKGGKTMAKYVTMRPGLLDRSKTIWQFVKPNYFEQVAP